MFDKRFLRTGFVVFCALFFSTAVRAITLCNEFIGIEPANATDILIEASSRTCTEYWDGPLAQSRALADIKSDDAVTLPPAFLELIKKGLEEADAALRHLGARKNIGTGVHVIITSLLDDPDPDEQALAAAEYVRGSCYLMIYPGSWQTESGLASIKFTMAHEIFHCLQYAELPVRLLEAEPPGSTANYWWVEGSAEWFGFVAYPDTPFTGDSQAYELHGNTRDLTSFNIDAWPFFAWYADEYGHENVMSYLEGLPARPHDAEVVTKFALTDEQWAQFATRFGAYTIRLLGGRQFNPPGIRALREPRTIEADGNYSFARPVGQLFRKEIILSPGKWALAPRTSGAEMHVSGINWKNDPDGAWLKFDKEIILETNCEEEGHTAIVGFGSSSGSADFEFTAKRIGDSCDATCGDLPATRDRCVVGWWEEGNWEGPFPGGSEPPYLKFMNQPAPTYTYFPDGVYVSDHPFHSLTSRPTSRGPSESETVYTINRAVGVWGTSGNTLVTCEKKDVSRGVLETRIDGKTMRISLDKDKPMRRIRQSTMTYTCDGNKIILSAPEIGLRRGELNRLGDIITPPPSGTPSTTP